MAWLKWRGSEKRGKWTAIWTERVGGRARKVYRALHRDRRTAEVMLHEIERNLALKGVGLGQVVPFRRLRDDYLKHLAANGCAPTYLARVRIVLAHVDRLYPGLKLPALTAPLLDDYKLKRLADQIDAATINRELGVVKAAVRSGRRWQYQVADLGEVANVRGAKKVRRGFTAEAIAGALEKASPLLAVVFRLGLYAGLRRMEILALRWTNVDWAQNALVLGDGWRTKNGRPRAVPLHPQLRAALLAWRGALAAPGPLPEHVVPWAATPQALTGRLVYFLRRKCGVPAGAVHTLRHTFITELKRQDTDTGKTMRLVGHATEKVTQGYTHLEVADLRADVERLKYE
jgi:integrase